MFALPYGLHLMWFAEDKDKLFTDSTLSLFCVFAFRYKERYACTKALELALTLSQKGSCFNCLVAKSK